VKVERIDVAAPDWAEDPRLADYRAVRDPVLVRRSNAFLAEGRLVLRALLASGRWRVRSLLLSDAALRWLVDERLAVPDGVPLYVLDGVAFRALSGHRFHQGCLAAADRGAPIPVDALLRRASARRVLALDAVTNPDNVGAMFRTASAFGVDAAVLSPECASPLYRKALRTSMGAALRLPFAHGGPWAEALASLKAAGFALLALTPAADAASLESVREEVGDGPLAVLAGAEGDGLGAASLAAADHRVRIPMRSGTDSLNVAAAAAIALYRLAPDGLV
jgi:tRNA G18 (ribose-2'-O)-methylase SpoU